METLCEQCNILLYPDIIYDIEIKRENHADKIYLTIGNAEYNRKFYVKTVHPNIDEYLNSSDVWLLDDEFANLDYVEEKDKYVNLDKVEYIDENCEEYKYSEDAVIQVYSNLLDWAKEYFTDHLIECEFYCNDYNEICEKYIHGNNYPNECSDCFIENCNECIPKDNLRQQIFQDFKNHCYYKDYSINRNCCINCKIRHLKYDRKIKNFLNNE
ncbi:MAG: hypothetical protein LBM96_05915 [Methanobrevibacter sp.]|jgi:hypothetical protein|nr:hypothetical protein [Candidatus Methanoflexus mossambicus]